MTMAWAIFHRECNWSRPNSRFSFNVQPSSEPQQRPRDLVDHCVGKGWATEVPPPTQKDAPADAGIMKRARKGRSRAL
ncbi:hypothetical protein MesoLjLc_45680 [Mesorhizobium sp. L-8-10]|uniref:hypothetical protein n=1 Tax=Mesorhizobium sp. L-8-10 TaxID=2744523 RepID=UPI001926C396|nr:hypothetical protein [Mesorhizobium sp. L-8-10]BCH32638.1 hypothetical protein MesoLjLc_45680 [Mesorhizobium sp. L-8-10]